MRLCQRRTLLVAFFLLARGSAFVSFLQRKTLSQSISRLHAHTNNAKRAKCDLPVEKTVVILYHKPPNVVTSHSTADAAPSNSPQRTTVYHYIESLQGYIGKDSTISCLRDIGIYSKLHAVGRLDVDTTGLLLLTNDGGLVHHVTNPMGQTSSLPKTYEAVIMGFWNDDSPAIQKMRLHGVDIGTKYGGQTKPPLSLSVLDHPTTKSTLVEISIKEGKNRQVRRMFHAIQSGVMKLHRTRIGKLTCGDLRQGQWRVLTNDEVQLHLEWKPRVLAATTDKKCGTNGQSRVVSGKRRMRQKRRKR